MRAIKKLLIIIFIISYSCLFAQNRNITAEQYIDKYKNLAIQEMLLTGIPASITLAQGMHESANGTSQLARNANNHFGVKCSSNWTGKKYYRNGNRRNSCFRKYNSVEEAFKDRSRFLSNNKNYAKLFTYKRTDYKKWAYGLQHSGYAASRYYAAHLIKTIERYDLHKYDLVDSLNISVDSLLKDSIEIDSIKPVSSIKNEKSNKVKQTKFHKVRSGDSLYTIAKKYKTTVTSIKKKNKLKSNKIKPGQKLIIP